MAFGLFWLVWILVETVRLGVGGLSLSLFTEMTPPPQAETGGLANAIFGSLLMVTLATLLGTPIGILAGIYLAEYGQRGWLGSVTRFINDILLSAPSIVIGLFVYAVVVARMQDLLRLGRRAGAGADRDPGRDPHHREHADAGPERAARGGLCAGHAEVAGDHDGHAASAARAGVITGILLAVARIAGETAPLLFTALSNQFWTSDLSAADGQPAGDDLQVRDEPVRELAAARLGRRVPDHARRAGAQHPRAHASSATSI